MVGFEVHRLNWPWQKIGFTCHHDEYEIIDNDMHAVIVFDQERNKIKDERRIILVLEKAKRIVGDSKSVMEFLRFYTTIICNHIRPYIHIEELEELLKKNSENESEGIMVYFNPSLQKVDAWPDWPDA